MTTAIATWAPPEGGWASDGTEDLPVRHPMISLTAPIAATREKPAGEFFHSDTEKSEPALAVVILSVREERVMFEEGSTEPVCRSFDGKVPVADMPLWDMEQVPLKHGPVAVLNFPGACNRCQFSEWLDGKAPPCGNGYVLLVDRGDGDLAQLRVRGTSIKPFKDFIARKPRGKPTYFFQTTITAEDRTRGTNRWFEMRFKGEPLEEADARRYDALLKAQAHRFEPTDEEYEVSAFMAEVSELMQAYTLKAADVAKYIGAPFSEASLREFMAENGRTEIELLLGEIQQATAPF